MDSRQVPVWVDITEEGDTVVVSLYGELDASARSSIEPVVMAAITSATTVTVDLGGVIFCDSSGVAMFIAVAQKADAEDTIFWVRNAPANVRRIFEIANLDHEFDVRD